MIVNNVSLAVTAVNQSQYPTDIRPEIAFIGRSNVGKSSLINSLINRKGLARTSSQPGKTRTINFYNVEEKIYFVDLPGYGYAKISKTEKEKWGNMIETYLKTREQLVCTVMIIDIRHEPSNLDMQMYEWLKYYNFNTVVVCTKADKLSKSQVNLNISKIKKLLNIDNDKIIPFSSETKQGKEELWNIINNVCEYDMENKI